MIKYLIISGLAYSCFFLGRVEGLKEAEQDRQLANLKIINCQNVITRNGIK
jgi:hypothetical protein